MKTQISIELTETKREDLDHFFEFQTDEEAIQLAAFTPKDPHDKDAYIQKFIKLLSDPEITMRTIKMNYVIVGSVSKYMMHGEAEITYWLDKKAWGKGIGTEALKQFLTIEKSRPIFGHVAFDNIGSQKVLENCGFEKTGSDMGFANARQAEIEEFIYRLNG